MVKARRVQVQGQSGSARLDPNQLDLNLIEPTETVRAAEVAEEAEAVAVALSDSLSCRDTHGFAHALDRKSRPICGQIVHLRLDGDHFNPEVDCLECLTVRE